MTAAARLSAYLTAHRKFNLPEVISHFGYRSPEVLTVTDIELLLERFEDHQQWRKAAMELHQSKRGLYGPVCKTCSGTTWPCPTARAFGVTA